MLVLTRKVGQSIIITVDAGKDNERRIEIQPLFNTNKKQIRLGITAPKDISVHRSEIQYKIDNGLFIDREDLID